MICCNMRCLSVFSLAALLSLPSLAQDKKPADKHNEKPDAAKHDDKKPADKKDDKAAAQPPSEAEMMAEMMKLAQPGENHKVLENMVGNWTYVNKFWMDPSGKPEESTGTSTAKWVYGGRYVVSEVKGKMKVPGADGKMTEMEFEGSSTEGYDNVGKKFIGTWIDNMGTGIMVYEGKYDPASKSFIYHSSYEPMPDMKTKIRMVVKIADKDHHTMEWYEDHGAGETKTMEIAYTRKS